MERLDVHILNYFLARENTNRCVRSHLDTRMNDGHGKCGTLKHDSLRNHFIAPILPNAAATHDISPLRPSTLKTGCSLAPRPFTVEPTSSPDSPLCGRLSQGLRLQTSRSPPVASQSRPSSSLSWSSSFIRISFFWRLDHVTRWMAVGAVLGTVMISLCEDLWQIFLEQDCVESSAHN